MDLWVVAAAAGAGYIAKNLQNLSADRKESPSGTLYKYSHNIQSESKNIFHQLRERTCPLRRLAQKRAQSDHFLELKNHSDVKFLEVDRISGRNAEGEPDSTSIDALERNGMDGDCNMGWISNFPSAFSSEENLKFEDGESRNLSRVNREKITRSKGCPLHPLRPLSSRGSYIDLQISKEHENMEDSSCLNPSMLRSFSLEQFESVDELQRQQEKCPADFESSGSGKGGSGGLFGSQEPGSMLLFMTGMTIGILSVTTSWKNEVDKLNKQLKQMQNLVQDLHEELDMKEMLMVEELTDEGHQEVNTPRSVQEPIASPSDVKSNKLTKFDSLKANDKNIENLELLSKIEAELQAELEMLERNMKTSALERISAAVELDPDFEPGIAQGDLKPITASATSDSENETTGTATNCSQPANYAVSPWELSLQLHELIESRLEKRIKELELALHNTQNRTKFLGSQSIVYGRRYSYGGTKFLPNDQFPTCLCDEHDKREDGPLPKNFFRNYMDAYEEPNGILLQVTNTDQEKEDKALINQIWDGEYDSISQKNVVKENRSQDLVWDMSQIWDKRKSTSSVSDEDCISEDEESSDESDMLLIKKIVERRKSGSSINLNID